MNCLKPVRIGVDIDEFPYHVKILVGCGRCPLCLHKKSNEWLFRLEATSRAYPEYSYFITLTYANEYLPGPLDNGLKDWQNFMKRFRKNNGITSASGFKFFAISELGGKHGRLHYHALLFGTNMDWHRIVLAIRRDWPFGRIRVDSILPERIHYVAKYALQNLTRPKKETRYYHDSKGNVLPVVYKPVNFFVSPHSNGIGLEYLTPQMCRYLLDRGDGLTVRDGYEIALPSYLLNHLIKLYEEDPSYTDTLRNIKKKRLQQAIAETAAHDRNLAIYRGSNLVALHGHGDFVGLPAPPEEWLRNTVKARRILAKAKKYKFTKPPAWTEEAAYPPPKWSQEYRMRHEKEET